MRRGKWQGMLSIARFNWPFYVAAFFVFFGSLGLVIFVLDWPVSLIAMLAALGSGYFFFVSLGVSHWVYDRSDLYRWRWLKMALGSTLVERIIYCHSGFDEASAALRECLKDAEWTLLDHHDPATMTEASIARARALYPPTAETRPAPFSLWPVKDEWADVVFGILAIHELRTIEERSEWFAEAKRCLRSGGRVIVIEHVRDLANFMAFGPGFLHFHAVKNWKRSWETAGLNLQTEFRITPWIRVFVVTKP